MDLIKYDNIDLKTILKENNKLNDQINTKFINELKYEFKEEEQKWYIVNLYMFLNYHPTNEFPINLETVWSMIGFANKGNAKRTLENNFIKDEDYKILQNFKEKQKKEKPASPNGKAGQHVREKNLGGAGLNEETIILNVDTFKNLCMISKTEKGNKIRKYYVKLENILNKIVKEEHDEYSKKLQEKDQLLIDTTIEFELKAQKDKEDQIIEMCKKYDGVIYLASIDDLYTYRQNEHSEERVEKLLSFGYTTNIKERIKQHKHDYKNFKILHVYKTEANVKIEQIIKDYCKVQSKKIPKNIVKQRYAEHRLRNITVKEKNRTEHLALDDDVYTVDYYHNMIEEILKQWDPTNHKNLLNKCDTSEKEILELKYKIKELENENTKLKKELEKYKPVTTPDERKINKFSNETTCGYYLYIFDCKFKNRYKIGSSRVSDDTEEILKRATPDGEMAYTVKINNPFYKDFLMFLLKKNKVRNIENIVFIGNIEDLKLMAVTVLMEKLFKDDNLYAIRDLLINYNNVMEKMFNTTEELEDNEPAVKKAKRSIDKIDILTDEVLGTYESQRAAAQSLTPPCTSEAIGMALRNKNACRGYFWMYSGFSTSNHGIHQPVIKINCKTGEKTYFDNMQQAGNDVGISYVAMRNRILTNTHVGNHHWGFNESATHYTADQNTFIPETNVSETNKKSSVSKKKTKFKNN